MSLNCHAFGSSKYRGRLYMVFEPNKMSSLDAPTRLQACNFTHSRGGLTNSPRKLGRLEGIPSVLLVDKEPGIEVAERREPIMQLRWIGSRFIECGGCHIEPVREYRSS